MAQNGHGRITPGRAYRAYRFPHHNGRLSRRPGLVGGGIGSLAGIAGIIVAVFALFAATAAASLISFFTADLPAAHDLETAPIPLSTFIYDRSGEHLLYRLEDERRELISLDLVPEKMQQATIAIEDKTFWSNPGVDIGGIVRAAQANARSGVISQGGSTITQQLIKTRLLGDEPTFARKIKEAILAVEATRIFVQGTEPKIDDRNAYVNGCYRLIAHFPDRQPYANTWAANAGKLSGGRFGGVCGTGAPASASPSVSPGANPSPSGPPAPSASPGPSLPPGQRTPTPPTPTPPPPTVTVPPLPTIHTPAPTKKP